MLQAEEASSRVLTMLLAAIASVSLLVGGIGIMNIMLVSVTERTREIGLRMAVGARGRDIRTAVPGGGGHALAHRGCIARIGIGLAASYGIAYFAEWRTLINAEAVLLAFGFSAAVGVFFGFYPAQQAAQLNPHRGPEVRMIPRLRPRRRRAVRHARLAPPAFAQTYSPQSRRRAERDLLGRARRQRAGHPLRRRAQWLIVVL